MQTLSSVVTAHRDVADSAAEVLAPLNRLLPAEYGDGIAEPRPAAAEADRIAFEVFTQGPREMPNPYGLSALWIFWGQFVDHDLSLSPEQEGPEAALLKLDPPFDVVRSAIAPGTGAEGVPAEQLNAITPLVDASNVYGSDLFRQTALRTLEGGRLKSQPGPDGVDLPPDAEAVFAAFLDYEGGETGYTAGDIRARENPGLTSIHALWVNEHNHWADRFAAEHPDWTDEEVFQSARAAVETLVQRITYEEFLPRLIGDALPAYAGFDPEAEAQILNEFSTAAFRFGHTAIPNRLAFLAEDGSALRPDAPLFETFENDAILAGTGAAAALRGVLEERAQTIDATVVDSLNFLLFTPDGGLTGFSLPERNILRGQDHGIPTWATVREAVLGDVDAAALAGSADFSVITPDPAVQAALASVYATVGEVDLWVGGLAEPHAPGAAIGPTFQAIVARQFAAVRDADPLFHAIREWTDPALAAELAATTLADVLMRSGGVEHVQRDAFLASDRQGGGDGADHMKGGPGRDLLIGFGGEDYLKGAGGEDDLFGGDGDDMLSGGAGSDGLSGGAGRDKLMGGHGPDRLAGGDGSDLLIGGEGADAFVFHAGETGMDTVMNFQDGEDRFELRGFGVDADALEIQRKGFMSLVAVEDKVIAEVWGGDHWKLDLSDFDLIG